jgi:dipeptidyl aminopeptidase/acylaminoacyl peptidase
LVWSLGGSSYADEPRGKGADKGKKPAAKRFELFDLGKLVGLSDPQIAPDERSIVVVVSRPDFDKNKFNSERVLIDVESGHQRVLTYEREGPRQPRWSPLGNRLAFLANQAPAKTPKHRFLPCR